MLIVVRNTMMTLNTNILNLIGRTIILFCSAGIIFLFIHFGLPQSNAKQIPILYFLIILMAFLFSGMFISLLGIIKVEIDNLTGEIIYSSFISKKSISKNEISGYYTTYSNAKHGRKIFYGIVLKLTNNKTIELNEYNLKTITGLQQYLINNKIELLGNKHSYFPFKIRS